MKYAHLYSDASGESRWRDVDVELSEQTFAPPAKSIRVSPTRPSTAMVFLRLNAGWNEPVHPTPKPQTLICTAGAVRVTASDGERRTISVGDIWLMEDTTGKGHHTEVIGDEDFEAVIVQHA